MVEPRITKSGPTEVRPSQVGPRQHSAIELGAAHVCLVQAGAPQQRLGHQRELHFCLGQTGVRKTCRNEVGPAQTGAG